MLFKKSLGEVVMAVRGARQMFLTDAIEAQALKKNRKEYLVRLAKERILSQLNSTGGFLIEKGGRKFELSSSASGSTGLY